MPDDLWSDEEWRAAMSAADINDLPDEDFAYIEDGGEKDEEGKTTPRDKRHFPIHDAAHVRNALARAPQSPFGDKAMPKILAAAKKFGVKVAEKKSEEAAVSVTPTRKMAKRPRHRSGPSLGVELRSFGALEVRDDNPDSNIVTLVGTPIVYDTPYFVRDGMGPRGGFDETMKPGVVSDLLAKGTDTRFLVGHNSSSLPLGRTTKGTLRLQDSPLGLQCEVDLDMRQSLAADLAIAVQRGDIDQMSIGMVVGSDKWDAAQENREIFSLRELADVSAVVFPASPTTSLDVLRHVVAEQIVRSTPVESRARFATGWKTIRELRDGRIPEPEVIDALSDTFRMLAEASDDILNDEALETPDAAGEELTASGTNEIRTDEICELSLTALADALADVMRAESAAGTSERWAWIAEVRTTVIDALAEFRAMPTPQDKGIAGKIKAAHKGVVDAIHAQMGDQDSATDPVDADVMTHLQNAHKALLKAIGSQAVDGAPDIPPGTLAGADGTIGNSSVGDNQVANDGSGVDARSEDEETVAAAPKRMTTTELRRDVELARIERARKEREKRTKS